ncbi:Uu.00g057260.m01.CDS01 [Anthostomella pinea]|uniref:Uu.00g057260.m01.CDS01 n=1 Tax=Anthostomella pinea TaxID=933095 RepID=A0AAI8YJR4_9PEZI|nr:Uu.00g057260.m01.CDS01 [Anthostomella pinea]
MASTSRPHQQDFIARIRYSNTLPPPPNPPKLLDIPNTGLSSGQYTAPGFASRLAREQPLNIEADAELGMPLDLVGMPGVFDGDESSIQAPAQPPPIHPHDRALLRPLQTLGKPKVSEPNVSFLRRTEYISSNSSKGKPDAGPLRALNPNPIKRSLKRPSPEPDKDSPAYVKRKIDQSFAIAAANLKDKSRIKHPSKRNVKCVEAYPMVPDLDAFPDSGAYVTVKFTINPLPPSRVYDKRLLGGLLRPIERSQEEEEAYNLARLAHERDPRSFPKPSAGTNYDFFLGDTVETTEKFKQKFDVENPDHDDPALYTNNKGDRPKFSFPRVRAYETVHETELDHSAKYDEELVLSFNEDEMIDQKAVFYYPVIQKSVIKPQRTKNIARTAGSGDMDDTPTDQLDVTVDEPHDGLRALMAHYKDKPYEPADEELALGGGPEQQLQQEEAAANGHDEEQETNGYAQQRANVSDDDQDAEGDEEE